MDETGLTIEELAERFGVSVRAVRFYIAQGLLPGPGSRGKAATYGEEHVVRLGLIRLLTDRHMPLAKIQALLDGLTLDEVKTLYATEEGLTTQLAEAEQSQSPHSYVATLLDDARRARGLPQSRSTPDYSRMPSQKARQSPSRLAAGMPLGAVRESEREAETDAEPWSRWTLAPGVELQVSAAARARYAHLLDALLRVAREQSEQRGDKGD